MQAGTRRLWPWSHRPREPKTVSPEPVSSLTRRLTAVERATEAALRGPALLRAPLARAAARKGLHAHALLCAPDDGYVLARAGLFHDVPEVGAPDAAELAALAGLGMTDALLERRAAWTGLSSADRTWIAGLAAAWDPLAANLMLTDAEPLARAACLLAEELGDEARALAEPAPPSPERSLLLAALAIEDEDPAAARDLINAAFVAQGLEAPLPTGNAVFGLEDFRTEAAPGQVSGPKVSLVVAVRNAAATLEMAVGSLLDQSWADLEILLVDDASDDETPAIAARLADRDPRVRVLANARTPGAYGARNTGLEAARGAYVGFHDGDDWAQPQRIEQQVRAIEAKDVAAAVSKHFRLAGDGRPVAPRVFPMIRACPISVLVRADAARAAGPMEEVRLGADSEYLARLDLLLGRRNVARLPQIHLVAGWAPSSLSGAAQTGLTSTEGRDVRAGYEREWRRRHAQRLKALLA